jgi:hypothetical protein
MPFSCFFFPFAIDIAIERQLFAAISFMPLFSPLAALADAIFAEPLIMILIVFRHFRFSIDSLIRHYYRLAFDAITPMFSPMPFLSIFSPLFIIGLLRHFISPCHINATLYAFHYAAFLHTPP